ncbi:MAG: MFS transporter [Rhodospirillaceae bacterium]|nr:MFS transporter [Rhodospirillaceae bacterium]MCA8931021.1 MFS transporter [Rhodospirillaceae bacterium]
MREQVGNEGKAEGKGPAGSRGLAVLAVAILLASLGVSIATVALPTLAQAFTTPMASVQWVVLAYLLSVTVAIVAGGRMGDLFGHRRVLLVGLAVFAAASAGAAVAPTLGVLIAARAAQGIGGAILMALPMSIARETVPTERTGAAMGLLGSMSAIGTALGPSVGGALIAWQGWRASFVLLALLGLGVLVLAARELPLAGPKQPQRRPRLDLAGMLVLAVSLTVYALAMTGAVAWMHGGVLLAAAAVGGVLFVLVERRAAAPLVHLPVLASRRIAASLAMNLLVATGMMATLVVGPFYLTFVLGLNEALVGLVMAAGPAISALSGVPAGRVTDRFGAPRILVFGLVEATVGFLCLALLPDLLGVAGYVVALALLTPGFQCFLAANNTATMVAAREDQRGMVSGLLGLSRNLGFMTGASAMGAVFAAAAGTQDVAHATAEAVSRGFSTTFLVAAGLMVVALIAALAGRRAGAPRTVRQEVG